MDFDRKFGLPQTQTSPPVHDCCYDSWPISTLLSLHTPLLHCWHNDVTLSAVSTPTVRAPCTRRRAPAASLSRVFQPVFTRPCGRSLVLVFSPQGHVQASCFVLQTLARFAFLWFSWHRSLSSVFGQDRFTLSFFVVFCCSRDNNKHLIA